jgi:hypothetical protein
MEKRTVIVKCISVSGLNILKHPVFYSDFDFVSWILLIVQ